MKSFEVKESFTTPGADDYIKKPSLNSVLARNKRKKDTEKRQQLLAEGIDPDLENNLPDSLDNADEPNYTEMEAKMMAEQASMSVVGHLGELRKRIIICALVILVGCCISYYFVDDILQILVAPAGKLYYMRPMEAFITYMKVALVSGFILVSPIILYEVWVFVRPALTREEKKLVNLFLPVAIILFLIGVLFSYFFVLPAAIKFFVGFGSDSLEPLLSIGQYIDFVLSFILPFGLIFELPLVVIALAFFNILNSHFLKKQRKIFILLSFVIGAVISPTPDIFSQSMIALPMVLLYEISVQIVGRVMRK